MIHSAIPILLVIEFACVVTGKNIRRFNILHIMSDDHRVELGAYGKYDPHVTPTIITPNLDALAESGTLFTNAFVNGPYCNPSRSSFLTARRPETTRIADFKDLPVYFRDRNNFTTLPQYLKSVGYRTLGVGKVFHSAPYVDTGDDNDYSWSEPMYQPPNFGDYFFDFNFNPMNSTFIVRDDAITSEDLIAEKATQILKNYASRDQSEPLYLAVGFYRPHMPLWAKQRTYDLYPESQIQLPRHTSVPENYSRQEWIGYGETLQYEDIQNVSRHLGLTPKQIKTLDSPFNKTLPDASIKSLRRAYYAAVTGTDELIGKILQTLKENHMDKNTVVIYNSDHGYLLGEHGEWTKFHPFDLGTRVPLLMRVPGMAQRKVVTSLVELVDLFPTIVDLLGLPQLPVCPTDSSKVALCREGMSFRPLMEKSQDLAGHIEGWQKPSFTRLYMTRLPPAFMWYSVRVEDYRYVRYMSFNATTLEMNFNDVKSELLFDYLADKYESINFAYSAHYSDIKTRLQTLLLEGWRPYVH